MNRRLFVTTFLMITFSTLFADIHYIIELPYFQNWDFAVSRKSQESTLRIEGYIAANEDGSYYDQYDGSTLGVESYSINTPGFESDSLDVFVENGKITGLEWDFEAQDDRWDEYIYHGSVSGTRISGYIEAIDVVFANPSEERDFSFSGSISQEEVGSLEERMNPTGAGEYTWDYAVAYTNHMRSEFQVGEGLISSTDSELEIEILDAQAAGDTLVLRYRIRSIYRFVNYEVATGEEDFDSGYEPLKWTAPVLYIDNQEVETRDYDEYDQQLPIGGNEVAIESFEYQIIREEDKGHIISKEPMENRGRDGEIYSQCFLKEYEIMYSIDFGRSGIIQPDSNIKLAMMYGYWIPIIIKYDEVNLVPGGVRSSGDTDSKINVTDTTKTDTNTSTGTSGVDSRDHDDNRPTSSDTASNPNPDDLLDPSNSDSITAALISLFLVGLITFPQLAQLLRTGGSLSDAKKIVQDNEEKQKQKDEEKGVYKLEFDADKNTLEVNSRESVHLWAWFSSTDAEKNKMAHTSLSSIQAECTDSEHVDITVEPSLADNNRLFYLSFEIDTESRYYDGEEYSIPKSGITVKLSGQDPDGKSHSIDVLFAVGTPDKKLQCSRERFFFHPKQTGPLGFKLYVPYAEKNEFTFSSELEMKESNTPLRLSEQKNADGKSCSYDLIYDGDFSTISRGALVVTAESSEQKLELRRSILAGKDGLLIMNKESPIRILGDSVSETELIVCAFTAGDTGFSGDIEVLDKMQFKFSHNKNNEQGELLEREHLRNTVNAYKCAAPYAEFKDFTDVEIINGEPPVRGLVYKLKTEKELPQGNKAALVKNAKRVFEGGMAAEPPQKEQIPFPGTLTISCETYESQEADVELVFPTELPASTFTELEYKRCRQVIAKHCPFELQDRMYDVVEKKKDILGPMGLYYIRHSIWEISANHWQSKALSEEAKDENLKLVEDILKWTEWAGDICASLVSSALLKAGVNLAIGFLKPLFISALKNIGSGKSWGDWASDELKGLLFSTPETIVTLAAFKGRMSSKPVIAFMTVITFLKTFVNKIDYDKWADANNRSYAELTKDIFDAAKTAGIEAGKTLAAGLMGEAFKRLTYQSAVKKGWKLAPDAQDEWNKMQKSGEA